MKLKITIVKKFSPEEVFGHEVKRTSGEVVPLCGLEERDYIVEHQFKMPEGFCGKADPGVDQNCPGAWRGGGHRAPLSGYSGSAHRDVAGDKKTGGHRTGLTDGPPDSLFVNKGLFTIVLSVRCYVLSLNT